MAEDIETQKDIGKLWGEIREFRAETEGRFREMTIILTGATGSNGVLGWVAEMEDETRRIKSKVDEAIAWGRQVVEVDRHIPGWCIGKKAVDELDARLTKDETMRRGEMVEMKKARYAMLTGMGVAALTGIGAIVLEIVKQ